MFVFSISLGYNFKIGDMKIIQLKSIEKRKSQKNAALVTLMESMKREKLKQLFSSFSTFFTICRQENT